MTKRAHAQAMHVTGGVRMLENVGDKQGAQRSQLSLPLLETTICSDAASWCNNWAQQLSEHSHSLGSCAMKYQVKNSADNIGECVVQTSVSEFVTVSAHAL